VSIEGTSDPGVIAALLADGAMHLHHGPIDLIITADGPSAIVSDVFARARRSMEPILQTLVAELPQLRLPATASPSVRGNVAQRMVVATSGHGDAFITPMAAVAGAVADHVLAAAVDPVARRIIVNNGGDIAFWLAPGERTRVGLVVDPQRPHLEAIANIDATDAVRGIATSGWPGRSMSLGIADAVTTLAANAAEADAAATLIASAVDLPGHPSIQRVAAVELDDASDLGDRLVTVGVGQLTLAEQQAAASAGEIVAQRLIAAGRIVAALIVVGDDRRLVGRPGLPTAGSPRAAIASSRSRHP
jgi:uncharacterized protein